MKKLFSTSGYVEAEDFLAANGSKIDFQALPAFLRVLLTTDGTVTKSLESWFWEPVEVQNLGQAYCILEEAVAAIECDSGARVLDRKVQLVGRNSQKIFTRASSLIRTELLEKAVREDLENGKVGVGELLRELGLETYREIVEFGENAEQSEVWRRYRIIMNHQPFIQITECFPLAAFADH